MAAGASTVELWTDRIGGGLAALRELFADGAFEVITPPLLNSNLPIDAKTVIQIDGDVLTLIRDVNLIPTLDIHFARVRARLRALEGLRKVVLAGLYIPAAGIGLWQGMEAIAVLVGFDQLWRAIWLHGTLVIAAGAFGAIVPRLVPVVLRSLVTVGKKRLFG